MQLYLGHVYLYSMPLSPKCCDKSYSRSSSGGERTRLRNSLERRNQSVFIIQFNFYASALMQIVESYHPYWISVAINKSERAGACKESQKLVVGFQSGLT